MAAGNFVEGDVAGRIVMCKTVVFPTPARR